MELIPLIYTILKVVAILAIATLIVSYLSFRNKLKNGTLDLTDSQKRQVTTSSNVTQPISQNPEKEDFLSQPLIRKIAAKERPKSNLKKESPRGKSLTKKTKSGKSDQSKRLQIIKELQPARNKKTTLKEEPRLLPKTDETLKSLDEDIISKYGEKDEENFHLLNVKERKDKHAK